MRNLLTKTLFISLLSSAVILSGASNAFLNGKKFGKAASEVVVGLAVGVGIVEGAFKILQRRIGEAAVYEVREGAVGRAVGEARTGAGVGVLAGAKGVITVGVSKGLEEGSNPLVAMAATGAVVVGTMGAVVVGTMGAIAGAAMMKKITKKIISPEKQQQTKDV